MGRTRVALVIALLVLVAGVAAAEHEVYYRYTVLGYVKDAAGKPLPGRIVDLIRDKTGLSYLGKTDDHGFFVITARLGDESAGEPLHLHVGPLQHALTATYDAANHVDERGTRVDLLGTRFVERRAWFRPTLARFLETPAR